MSEHKIEHICGINLCIYCGVLSTDDAMHFECKATDMQIAKPLVELDATRVATPGVHHDVETGCITVVGSPPKEARSFVVGWGNPCAKIEPSMTKFEIGDVMMKPMVVADASSENLRIVPGAITSVVRTPPLDARHSQYMEAYHRRLRALADSVRNKNVLIHVEPAPVEPPKPEPVVEKKSKFIHDMTEQDWRRGTDAIFDSYRII